MSINYKQLLENVRLSNNLLYNKTNIDYQYFLQVYDDLFRCNFKLYNNSKYLYEVKFNYHKLDSHYIIECFINDIHINIFYNDIFIRDTLFDLPRCLDLSKLNNIIDNINKSYYNFDKKIIQINELYKYRNLLYYKLVLSKLINKYSDESMDYLYLYLF